MVNGNIVFSSIDAADCVAGVIVNIAASIIVAVVVVDQFVAIDVDGKQKNKHPGIIGNTEGNRPFCIGYTGSDQDPIQEQ